MKNLSCLNDLFDHKIRALRLRGMRFCLDQDRLGWRNLDGIILRCVNKEGANELVEKFQSKYCGGHFASRTTAHKILRTSYYWLTMFTETYFYVRSLQPCQCFLEKPWLTALPLKLVLVEAPFQQWDLNFINEFKEKSSNGYRWVLVARNYFTRWVNSIPTKKAIEEVVMSFLEDQIITRFGSPTKITTDNAKDFSSLACQILLQIWNCVVSFF